MKVLLLEKIKKLGNVGDLILVKDGYARNYLFPRKKALRFTKENQEKFEAEKAVIEKANAQKKELALTNSQKITGKTISIIRQAADDGRLYGSVSNKDIVKHIQSLFNVKISVEDITIDKVKEIGLYDFTVHLHSDVEASMKIVVSRSEEEAKNTIAEEKEKVKKAKEAATAKDVKKEKIEDQLNDTKKESKQQD